MTAPLNVYERRYFRGKAQAILDRPHIASLHTELYDTLLDGTGLYDGSLEMTAFHEPAERFTAIRETFAKEIGKLVADLVRRAFDAAERTMRAQMQEGLREVWRREDGAA